jgi:hypothetical protein
MSPPAFHAAFSEYLALEGLSVANPVQVLIPVQVLCGDSIKKILIIRHQ